MRFGPLAEAITGWCVEPPQGEQAGREGGRCLPRAVGRDRSKVDRVGLGTQDGGALHRREGAHAF